MNPSQPLSELRFRPFQGHTDYAQIWAILRACTSADRLERSDTLEDVERTYTHLHHCDPYRDMLFAEVNGQTVGYVRGWWDIEESSEPKWLGVHLGFVSPAWRGKGIGRNLLDFVETRLAEVAAELVQQGQLAPELPRFASCEVYDTETAKTALLEYAGHQAVRYGLDMVRPDLENIPDLPLPADLQVRPVLPEHYRAVWDACNEAFRDHWGYIPEPEEEFYKMQESPEFDPSLWRVAWEGDQVAGMVLSFINAAENSEYNRKRGYTENICVRRPWRGKGLAKALIALSLQAIKERGMEHAALGVDSQNLSGALQLYQSMGYEVVKRMAIYRKRLG